MGGFNFRTWTLGCNFEGNSGFYQPQNFWVAKTLMSPFTDSLTYATQKVFSRAVKTCTLDPNLLAQLVMPCHFNIQTCYFYSSSRRLKRLIFFFCINYMRQILSVNKESPTVAYTSTTLEAMPERDYCIFRYIKKGTCRDLTGWSIRVTKTVI